MMPFQESVRAVWSRLDYLQREQNDRPPRPSGLSRNVGFRRPTLGHNDSSARMRRVRTALVMSKDRACSMLVERLSGINLSMVLGALISACEEVAVIWGGSVLLGGTIGGGIGICVGGIGVAPGAVLGAGMGAQVGLWILGFLGLKSLIEDLGTAVPEVLRLYEQGFRTAWGRLDDGGSFLPHDGDDSSRTWSATSDFAQGHVLMMVTMLTALMAYLSRGRGDPAAKARILQEIRESPRLGHKVADWVEANEEALARHPGLKPKEQQVVMSQAKPPAEPPMTPSQLRRLADPGPSAAAPVPKPSARIFKNQVPENLQKELAVAERLGVRPVSPKSPEFDDLINQGTVKFAVTESGELLVVPKYAADGTEISHAVITKGKPVLSAGEVEIAGGAADGYIGMQMLPHSGHYMNGNTSVQNAAVTKIAEEAFAKYGIRF